MATDMKSMEINLRNQLYSSKRELRKQRAAYNNTDDVDPQKKKIMEFCKRVKQKIATLEAMLSTVETKKSQHQPKIIPKKRLVYPFDVTETRTCRKPLKRAQTPHFYLGNHEWNFGLESKVKTISMGAWNFSEHDRFDRDLEYFNDPSVLVGIQRPHSRMRKTDFFGMRTKHQMDLELRNDKRTPDTSNLTLPSLLSVSRGNSRCGESNYSRSIGSAHSPLSLGNVSVMGTTRGSVSVLPISRQHSPEKGMRASPMSANSLTLSNGGARETGPSTTGSAASSRGNSRGGSRGAATGRSVILNAL